MIASAGSDRKFDRSTWEKLAKTTSTADDIVLRNGKIVRSPEEWAIRLAKLTPERMKGDRSRSKHAQTVAQLRSIMTAMDVYQIDAGKLPAVNVGDIEGLAKHLEPSYMPKMPRQDAWNHKLDIAMLSTGNGYYLASAGPDGEHNTDDDIVVENGEFTRNEKAPAQDRLVSFFTGYQAARMRLETGQ